jgi:hypothetical protein
MIRSRRAPVHHPLAACFGRAVDSITTSLAPDSGRHYRGVVRHFLIYLETEYPNLRALDQLRRDPHILGWMARLHSQTPPFGDSLLHQ